MKWSIAVIVILVAFALAYRLYYERVTNPGVAEEIRTNPQGERAGIVMLLTLPDGMVLPVNYLHEGNEVFAGADGRWWRAFQGEGADVSVLIRGATLMGRAKVVLDDQNYVEDVFSRLRPTAPAWLPDWLNGKLVVITLDGNETL